ncbi:MAG: cyclic nucleotide-binding domain-containing protein, partial [Rhodothermales bacterium]
LYVISKGTARVDVRLPDGSTSTIATLRKGDFVGEMEMLYGERNVATVTTTRFAEVIELTYASLARIIARYPLVENVLRAVYHHRLLVQARYNA